MKLKSIIRWEQLRGKPYGAFDPADADDLEALLYVRQLEADPAATPTFGTWRRVLQNAKLASRLVSDLRRELDVQAQFFTKQKDTEKAEDGQQPYSRLAAWLVAQGMGAEYVMERMELQDVQAFVRAFDERSRQQLEADRYWTWLAILPHTGTKPFPNGAADLCRFPWEDKPRREGIADRDIRAFEAFMKKRGKTD